MFNRLSRRQFVKMTGGFVVGTAAAGSFTLIPEKTQAAVISSISSNYRPALAHNPSQNGPLYVAWTTSKGELDYAFSTNPNDANSWTISPRGIGGGPVHPALTFFNNQLYIAFTDSSKQLRLGYLENNGFNFDPVSNLPRVTSAHGPALSFHLGQLYIAWTGTNGQLNIISSANPSKGNWNQSPYPLSEFSKYGPALATYNNRIWLAWSGRDGQLNSRSGIDINDADLYRGKKTTYKDLSVDAPALATLNKSLYLAWKGTNSYLNYVPISGSGYTVTKYSQTSQHGPALDNYKGSLYLAWAGTDNQLIRVTQL